MKNYKEVTQNLLERRERYVEAQVKRRKKLIGAVKICSCICMVFLLGYEVWDGPIDVPAPQVPSQNTQNEKEDENINSEDENLPKKYPDLTMHSLEQWLEVEAVVWNGGTPTKGNQPTGLTVAMGKSMISEELVKEFDGNSDDTVYAIMVDFTPMLPKDLVYEGKTISEWNIEKERLIAQDMHAEAKAIVQKINTAKEAYYFEQIEIFKEKFAEMGMGVYHEKYGCTIDNCIFYTFATRIQIEEFKCDENEAFIFTIAVRFK